MKNSLYCVAILLFFVSCANSSKAPRSIEERIQYTLADNNIPSLSIGVVKNGKIELLKGYGTFSREDRTIVTENSIFQIASQSKMFTGIIANNLILEGKLDIDKPISEYIPNGIALSAKDVLSKVTMRHILNHTAGIPSDACSVYRERKEGEAWLNGYSKTELIKDINQLKLDFEPGTKFQYSNSGYAIAGFILEQVSGLSYEALLRKYLADAYNLKNTIVNLNSVQTSSLVTPYKKDKREIATKPSNMGMATPASAVYSDVRDLTNILKAQIKAYRQNETTNPLMLTHTTSSMGNGLDYGFGLIKETKEDNIKYGHGGDADGFACEYFFNPNENAGVVILTSSGGSWVGELANSILKNLKS